MISGRKIPQEPGAVVLVGDDVDRSMATKLLKSIRSISNEFKSCVSPVVVPESRYYCAFASKTRFACTNDLFTSSGGSGPWICMEELHNPHLYLGFRL